MPDSAETSVTTHERESTTGSGLANTSTGDSRWFGPSREELLGQRAGQRATGGIAESVSLRSDALPDDDAPVTELPDLESDVYLLEPDGNSSRARRRRVLQPLHGLALDTALSSGGDVLWIDTQGHATTQALTQVAPAERVLSRVHVARGFTTHQHYTLIQQLGRWVRDGYESESPFEMPRTSRPAVLVCPALDALYRKGELGNNDATEYLVRAVSVIASLAREHDLPVLLTRTQADEFAAPIERAATTISLEQTRFGPQFTCEDVEFETLVYPGSHGVQTTLGFWKQALEARHPEVTVRATEEESGAAMPHSTVKQGN